MRKAWGIKEKADQSSFTQFELGDEVRIRVLDEDPPVWLPSHRLEGMGKDRRTIYVPCLGDVECNRIRLSDGRSLHELNKPGDHWSLRIWNFNTGRAEILNQGRRIFKVLESINDDEQQPEINQVDIKISCVKANSPAFKQDYEISVMAKSRAITQEMVDEVNALSIKKPALEDIITKLLNEGLMSPPRKGKVPVVEDEDEDEEPPPEPRPDEDPFADPEETARVIEDLLKD